MSWIAVAGGALSAIGGIFGASASEEAAKQQADAERQALSLQSKEFNTITGQQQPYIQAGYGGLGQLDYLLGIGTPGTAATPGVGGSSQGVAPTAATSPAGGYGSLLQPFNLSDWQSLSPAYSFQKQQGTQGVLNADAAGAGALSGSAQKDLINYNQNLANTSFNNAFNQYTTQQNNIFSRLSGIANLGQSAAANTAQSGVALTGQQGNTLSNIGTALAGGTIGSANALTGGANSAAAWLAYGGGGGRGGSSLSSSIPSSDYTGNVDGGWGGTPAWGVGGGDG